MKYFVVVAGILFSLIIYADNPLLLPEYTRNIRITFSTPEAAQKAKLSIAPLYENKKLAFSSRWDDTVPQHLKMSNILKKHGYKGTFYIVGAKENYCRKILDGVLKNGSSVGAHTMTHAGMPNLNPNAAFQQCLENRILLEARTDSPVITFVLPGCADNLYIGPEKRTPHTIGKILQRCGFIGSPEFPVNLAKRYNLPKDTYFGSYLFAPGDRNPLPEKFDKALAHRLQVMKKNKDHDQPHVTLGLHTWHTEEGFANLEKSLKKYGNNPDWWYCEENEYCVYRYQYLHTKIKKTDINGNTVNYKITSIKPRSFGVHVPLTLLLSEPAEKIEFEGKTIAANTEKFNLPASQDQHVSTKTAVVENSKNQALKDAVKESAKFPGIKSALEIDLSPNRLLFIIKNESSSKLQNVTTTFRLPMKWKNGVVRKTLPDLPSGKEQIIKFDMGPMNKDLESNEGTLFFAAETDFDYGNQSGRLYSVCKIEQSRKITDAPRDNTRIIGPLAYTSELKDYFKRTSCIDTPLKPFADSVHAKWLKTKVAPCTSPLRIKMSADDKNWKYIKPEGDNFVLALLLQFKSSQKDNSLLYIRHDLFKTVFINGTELSKNDLIKKRKRNIPVNQGLNRLIIVFPYDPKNHRLRNLNIAVAKDDPRVNFLPCE